MCSFKSSQLFIDYLYNDSPDLAEDTEERLKQELYSCTGAPCWACSSRLMELLPDMPLEEYCAHMVISAYGGHMDNYNHICELGVELPEEPNKTIAELALEVYNAMKKRQAEYDAMV
jgi:hypothetical protein